MSLAEYSRVAEAKRPPLRLRESYLEYERRKRQIEVLDLSEAEYLRRILALAKELGI